MEETLETLPVVILKWPTLYAIGGGRSRYICDVASYLISHLTSEVRRSVPSYLITILARPPALCNHTAVLTYWTLVAAMATGTRFAPIGKYPLTGLLDKAFPIKKRNTKTTTGKVRKQVEKYPEQIDIVSPDLCGTSARWPDSHYCFINASTGEQ